MRKIKEMRGMTDKELLELKAELSELAMTNKGFIHPRIPLNNGYENVKRAIARINTLLREREIKREA